MASSDTSTTITHVAGVQPLQVGDAIIISGHSDDMTALSISSNVASSSTSTTITHVIGANSLSVGDTVTVSGHNGNAANKAMNQAYVVASVTSATEAVLTGTGMTAGTYSTGTIVADVSNSAAVLAMNQEFVVASVTSTTEAVLTGSGMTAGTYSAGTIIATVDAVSPGAAAAAMNQVYVVASVTSSTETVLTGTGMTPGSYTNGTIVATLPGTSYYKKEEEMVQTIRMTRLDSTRAFVCWVHNQTRIDCTEVFVDSNYALSRVNGTMSIALNGTTTNAEYYSGSVVTQMDVASLTSSSVIACWTINRHASDNVIKCNVLAKGNPQWSTNTLRTVVVTPNNAALSALRVVRLKDLLAIVCAPIHDTGTTFNLHCTLLVDDGITLTSSVNTSATTINIGALDFDDASTEDNFDITRMSDLTAMVCWRDGSDAFKDGKCVILEVNSASTSMIQKGATQFIVSSPRTDCASGGYPGAFDIRVTSITPTSAIVCFTYSTSLYLSLTTPPGRLPSCVAIGWSGTDNSLHFLLDSNSLPVTTGKADYGFATDINGKLPSNLGIMSPSVAAFTNSTTDRLNFTNRALYCYETDFRIKNISCTSLILSKDTLPSTGPCVNGNRGNTCNVDSNSVYIHEHTPEHTSSYLSSTSSNADGSSNMTLTIPNPRLPSTCSFHTKIVIWITTCNILSDSCLCNS